MLIPILFWLALFSAPAMGQDAPAPDPAPDPAPEPAPDEPQPGEVGEPMVEVPDEEVPETPTQAPYWCPSGLATETGVCLEGFQMVEVPGGGFVVGDAVGLNGRFSVEKRREVVLSRSVWLNRTEVTQQQFEAVMGFNPSSTCAGVADPRRPVSCVSWNDVLAFANALSQAKGYTPAYSVKNGRWVWDREADGYRLPTSMEWERAARGGRATTYAGSDNPLAVGWFRENSPRTPQPVGLRMPNHYGLYDMSGNVWEWVWDGMSSGMVPTKAKTERTDFARSRIQRGGSYADDAEWLRVSAVDSDAVGYFGPTVGFRLARNGTLTPESEMPIQEPDGASKKKGKKAKKDKKKGKDTSSTS